MATRRPSPQRAERAALEGIEIEIVGDTRRDYEAWVQRAALLEDQRDAVTRFSVWYPTCEQQWLDCAVERGIWTSSERSDKADARDCRRRAETVGHARRDDGLVVHFVVEASPDRVAFRAKYCRTVPVFHLDRHWTDEQRLTWEEFTSGAVCRGCGRGFVGAPEWKPILKRTPEEAAALDREEAAYKALHPTCATMTWRYGSTGVTHCSECCPPPPLSPEQEKGIARILADVILRTHREKAELERRWEKTASVPSS